MSYKACAKNVLFVLALQWHVDRSVCW